ncbi:MAG: AbrB/MazE/SpoVT family DNA-binding domain-containing protein [Alphaproteobacteria bacterium]
MSTATVTSKGQLTLPKEIRDALGLSAGDKVNFVLMKDGNYALLPATHSVKTLEGFFHQPGRKPVSLEEMDEAIADGATGA